MPKQTLTKRLERLIADVAKNDGKVDIAARWQKIVEDGVGAEAAATLGPIPTPTLDDIALPDAIHYACSDSDATLRINPILDRKINELGLRQALELDEAVVPMIARMQQNGMLVDREHLAILSDVFASTLADIEISAFRAAGCEFNLASADQVAEVLFSRLSLSGGKWTPSRKRYSTDEKALERLKGRHPVIPLIQQHREVSKLKGTYVDVLPTLLSPDGRIRMELGLTVVPSGRLNCWGGVNLLAIPVRTELGREIRRAFVAPPGCRLCGIDLNQIELRALAVLSGDDHLLDAYANGLDLHGLTAAEALYHIPLESVVFEQRQRGKIVNFAIANQISAPGLRDQFILAGITDIDELECQQILNQWYRHYDRVQPWFESVYEEGRRYGYIRDMLSGRILWTPGLRSPIERVRTEAERIATNWKLQVFAQVILKLGMAALWEFLQQWWREGYDRLEPLLAVHDELILEASTDIEQDMLTHTLVEIVTGAAPKLPIPVVAAAHYGLSWRDLK